MALFKRKRFGSFRPKPLHLPLVRLNAPMEIRIVTMAEFHKSGFSEPLLWNCAAAAARINRFSVYSADIIILTLFSYFNCVLPCLGYHKLGTLTKNRAGFSPVFRTYDRGLYV